MRDITKVIKHMLTVIPETEIMTHERLKSISTRSCYCPPESQRENWLLLSQSLGELLGFPDCEWKLRILNIMTDKEKIP